MQNLKYRFLVQYLDGSIFKQNADDVSATDPKRSAFFDVVQKNVRHFILGEFYSVDLQDGSFEVYGKRFFMHDGFIKDFRLVFFRRHQHDYIAGVKDGNYSGEGKEGEYRISYHFGWQGIDENGKNVQRIMVIK